MCFFFSHRKHPTRYVPCRPGANIFMWESYMLLQKMEYHRVCKSLVQWLLAPLYTQLLVSQFSTQVISKSVEALWKMSTPIARTPWTSKFQMSVLSWWFYKLTHFSCRLRFPLSPMFFAQVKKTLFKPVLVSCSCRFSISVSYTLKTWQKGEKGKGVEMENQIRRKKRREK